MLLSEEAMAWCYHFPLELGICKASEVDAG